jgi:hypothetical protein
MNRFDVTRYQVSLVPKLATDRVLVCFPNAPKLGTMAFNKLVPRPAVS